MQIKTTHLECKKKQPIYLNAHKLNEKIYQWKAKFYLKYNFSIELQTAHCNKRYFLGKKKSSHHNPYTPFVVAALDYNYIYNEIHYIVEQIKRGRSRSLAISLR